MGKEENKEMEFWTQDEFQAFLECVADKPISYYAFEILYWTGIREGELLALTPADFNFEKKTLRINKSYQRLEGKDVITDPKTPKSNRTIVMPDFLAVEMEDFISSLFGIKDCDRIFTISKSYLHHEMDRGAKLAGVKRIRIHGLRHSHISLLINLGFSALAIGERVGHEAVDITYHYGVDWGKSQGCWDRKVKIARELLELEALLLFIGTKLIHFLEEHYRTWHVRNNSNMHNLVP